MKSSVHHTYFFTVWSTTPHSEGGGGGYKHYFSVCLKHSCGMSGILKFPRTGHGFHLRNECANLTSNGITIIAETSSSTFVCTGEQLFFLWLQVQCSCCTKGWEISHQFRTS